MLNNVLDGATNLDTLLLSSQTFPRHLVDLDVVTHGVFANPNNLLVLLRAIEVLCKKVLRLLLVDLKDHSEDKKFTLVVAPQNKELAQLLLRKYGALITLGQFLSGVMLVVGLYQNIARGFESQSLFQDGFTEGQEAGLMSILAESYVCYVAVGESFVILLLPDGSQFVVGELFGCCGFTKIFPVKVWNSLATLRRLAFGRLLRGLTTL